MKRKKYYVAFAAISLIFLALISAVTFSLVLSMRGKSTQSEGEKAPVYIYVNGDGYESESDTDTADERWLVKEHSEKIGIFDSNGSLVQVIDTYVRTLPQADRAELAEGFWIDSRAELRAIIEAYSD